MKYQLYVMINWSNNTIRFRYQKVGKPVNPIRWAGYTVIKTNVIYKEGDERLYQWLDYNNIMSKRNYPVVFLAYIYRKNKLRAIKEFNTSGEFKVWYKKWLRNNNHVKISTNALTQYDSMTYVMVKRGNNI